MPAAAHPPTAEARTAVEQSTGHRLTVAQIRFCRLHGTGAPFVACLHAADGHRQGQPGHRWADYQRQARQLRRFLTPRIPFEANWDRVAACESGGNWVINTGNGYYGGLQFSLSTWRGVGGQGYPHQNSKAEQIRRAEILRTGSGLHHWPVCGPRWYW